ncbi:hypothetical protein M501DRAFT_1045441 [Patellaria atrata CBS 101060]|uniref:Uncharacterized protein n=1 Tax=Patellaria atrata CBS 101060 TaxID=1346257 RepID=A0A9P4S382_9PEZI|nr:hypothetical protein M501DRAFT_1045441 [Patellaria atrata CBS 101060]
MGGKHIRAREYDAGIRAAYEQNIVRILEAFKIPYERFREQQSFKEAERVLEINSGLRVEISSLKQNIEALMKEKEEKEEKEALVEKLSEERDGLKEKLEKHREILVKSHTLAMKIQAEYDATEEAYLKQQARLRGE